MGSFLVRDSDNIEHYVCSDYGSVGFSVSNGRIVL